MPVATASAIANRLSAAGHSLPSPIVERLSVYLHLLRRWNRRVSLTSLRIEELSEEALDRLIVEPAAAAEHFPRTGPIIDIGSGGGSPAIPLKLILPGAALVMVEARSRKAAFLREAIRELELSDSSVREIRAERLIGDELLRGTAQSVTIRAVKLRPDVLDAARSVVATSGRIYVFSHQSAQNEASLGSFALLRTVVLLPPMGSTLTIYVPRGT